MNPLAKYCDKHGVLHWGDRECPDCLQAEEIERDRERRVATSRSEIDKIFAVLPADATERKSIPMATGLLDYFPLALAEVAKLSKIGNDQHNPGQPMHWARGKSTDHADTILRHLIDRGTIDTDGVRHATKVAWRALAMLQQELEDAGGKPGRGSRFT